MSYFGVLLAFIGPPLAILALVALLDRRQGRQLALPFRTLPAWIPLWVHVAIALFYTTPWDNYLVANRIWWYDPALVTGITLGWVPIEEYTFFVVQTLMTGLWTLALMRRLPPPAEAFQPRPRLRWISSAAVILFWLAWVVLLLSGQQRGLYMALLIVWGLLPVIVQFVFGADILWHHRRLLLAGILPPFVYLCLVDAIAISGSTWTINPDNTLGLDLAGILPLEEIAFFLITNVLIVFGLTLVLARSSHERLRNRAVPNTDRV